VLHRTIASNPGITTHSRAAPLQLVARPSLRLDSASWLAAGSRLRIPFTAVTTFGRATPSAEAIVVIPSWRLLSAALGGPRPSRVVAIATIPPAIAPGCRPVVAVVAVPTRRRLSAAILVQRKPRPAPLVVVASVVAPVVATVIAAVAT
jgi:hypothetical protein